MTTPNEQADEEMDRILRELVARVCALFGASLADLNPEDAEAQFKAKAALQALIAQHAKAAERLARIEELEEVKKYFPEYASASTARLLLCVNNRIVVLEAELAAAQRKDGDAVQN